MKRSGVMLVVLTGLSCVGNGVARSEVVASSVSGFIVKNVVTTDVSPERVSEALLDEVGQWWDSNHTYSGDSANLSIDARPGGCFCESFGERGGVQHLQVAYVDRGKVVRMLGGLGPLQQMAVTGSLTWTFTRKDETTEIALVYAVTGYSPGGLEAISGAVDSVQREQLERLKEYVESPSP